jgi:hypothetical protein
MTRPKLLGTLDLGEDPVERHGLVIDVGGVGELGVDRDEIVHAADLDAVAGVVDHGPVVLGRLVAEGLQLLGELRQGKIVLLDHLEAKLPQARGRRCRSS